MGAWPNTPHIQTLSRARIAPLRGLFHGADGTAWETSVKKVGNLGIDAPNCPISESPLRENPYNLTSFIPYQRQISPKLWQSSYIGKNNRDFLGFDHRGSHDYI
jgi:hypothetical protein